MLIVAWKQPVPDAKVPLLVYVKLVASAIFNTVCPLPVLVKIILAAPNIIALVPVPVELKLPVDNANPFKFKVPDVNVVVPVTWFTLAADSRVVVPLLLITNPNKPTAPAKSRLLAEPTIFTIRVLYPNPPPVNVKLPYRKTLDAAINAPVWPDKNVKFLKEEPLIVATAEPEVKVRFGTVVDEAPAVVPQVNVLVIDIAEAKPPVPVELNPVTVAILNTTVAAVV